jgi:phosphatidylinositol-3,4,5-trisphosphate 3-phosphatase and dual-specificity protein phosphatase PTEN
MSWPADRMYQKMYRNNVWNVRAYLDKFHESNYWVYNVSGTPYDPALLNGHVSLYDWADHHSPTLLLLFQACQAMHEWLSKSDKNVAIVHCNAGKGRTGTLICCYLLYCGFADSA